MSDNTNRPETTLRDGNLKATVWRQQGKDRDFFTTDFAKTYEDKDGNLKDSRSFGEKDLLGISELARQAHNQVKGLRKEAFREQRQEGNNRSRSRSR